jgi:hypothetical protein
VHLLMTPRVDNAVSRLMQSMGRRYVGHFNYSYARSGTLFAEALDIDTIAKICHCTNTGLVLGTEKFRDQVAALRS